MNQVYQQSLRKILSTSWKGKPIWEYIKDETLTCAPPFKGDLYELTSHKLMFFGHAVNGWEVDFPNCDTLDKTLDSILEQPNGLNTVVVEKGFPYITKSGKTRVYRHIHSKFFRLIKQVLEFQGESDSPTSGETWYHDSKEWYKKFVWSNLYVVAPRRTGNPSGSLINANLKEYTDLFVSQIEEYKPDFAIVLPLSGYFAWDNAPTFDKRLDSYSKCNIENTIIGEGTLGKTRIIVCTRPDRWGMSKNDVQNMAKCISDYINRYCN